MPKKKGKKGESRIVKKIQEQQQVADETVMDLNRADNDFHKELNSLHDGVMKRMRCRILKFKKKINGGLSATEERELLLLGDC